MRVLSTVQSFSLGLISCLGAGFGHVLAALLNFGNEQDFRPLGGTRQTRFSTSKWLPQHQFPHAVVCFQEGSPRISEGSKQEFPHKVELPQRQFPHALGVFSDAIPRNLSASRQGFPQIFVDKALCFHMNLVSPKQDLSRQSHTNLGLTEQVLADKALCFHVNLGHFAAG